MFLHCGCLSLSLCENIPVFIPRLKGKAQMFFLRWLKACWHTASVQILQFFGVIIHRPSVIPSITLEHQTTHVQYEPGRSKESIKVRKTNLYFEKGRAATLGSNPVSERVYTAVCANTRCNASSSSQGNMYARLRESSMSRSDHSVWEIVRYIRVKHYADLSGFKWRAGSTVH